MNFLRTKFLNLLLFLVLCSLMIRCGGDTVEHYKFTANPEWSSGGTISLLRTEFDQTVSRKDGCSSQPVEAPSPPVIRYNLALSDRAGNIRRTLAANFSTRDKVRWSARPDRLLFARGIPGSSSAVGVVDTLGHVTAIGSFPTATDVAWGPGDSLIACCARDTGSAPLKLYIARSDGSNLHIAQDTLLSSVYNVAWSGRNVIAVTFTGTNGVSGEYSLGLVDPATGMLTAVPDTLIRSNVLEWMPDGSGLIYSKFRNGAIDDITLLDVPSLSRRALTSTSNLTGLRIAPDGAFLAYVSGSILTAYDIAGDATSVISGIAYFGFCWSPDAGSLLYVDGGELTVKKIKSMTNANRNR